MLATQRASANLAIPATNAKKDRNVTEFRGFLKQVGQSSSPGRALPLPAVAGGQTGVIANGGSG